MWAFLLSNESAMLKEKKRAAYYTSSLSQLLGVDGVIVSEEGGGISETDLMFNCRLHEIRESRPFWLRMSTAGVDGASQGLADVTPEAGCLW